MAKAQLKPSESRRHFYRVEAKSLFSVDTGRPLSIGGGVEYEGADVSVYGIAMLVPGTEEQMVSPGLVLKNLAFELDGRRIVVDARVQYVRPEKVSDSKSVFKVGVEFTRIEPDDVWFLSSYVAKHEARTTPHPVRVVIRKKKAEKGAKKVAPKKTPSKAKKKKVSRVRAKTKARPAASRASRKRPASKGRRQKR